MTIPNRGGQNHSRIVATVPKNKREILALSLSMFKGNLYVDLRAWLTTDDGPRATQKGVSINVERIPALIAGLHRVQAELDKAGPLE